MHRRTALTVGEKILIHLADYTRYAERYEVPGEVTQNGIAEALGIGRAHAAIALRALKTQARVTESLRHVHKQPTRRKVYFLNQSGETFVNTLRNSISAKQVVLITEQDAEKTVKGNFAVDYLTSNLKMSLPDAYDWVLYNDLIDWRKVKSKLLDKKKPILGDEPPKLKYFFGRKEELSTIRSWLQDKTLKTIVLLGLPGSGKTTLALKIMEDYRQTLSIFWCSLYDWTTAKSVWRAVAEFLMRHGRENLYNYLKMRAELEIDYTECKYNVELDLQNFNALFIFDNYASKTELNNLLTILMDAGKENVKILITARTLPTFYSRKDVTVEKKVAELVLKGLDFESAISLLNAAGQEYDANFENFYKLVDGNPLFILFYSAKTAYPDKIADVFRYLEDGLLRSCTEAERKLLSYLSVFRLPAPLSALYQLADSSTINTLTQKLILSKLNSEFVTVHPTITAFFHKHTAPKELKMYHEIAASYYLEIERPLEIIECIYHLKCANKINELSIVATEYAQYLVKNGFSAELLTLFKDVNLQKIDVDLRKKVMEMVGDLHYTEGDFQKALSYYKDCKKMADTDFENAVLNWKIADIYIQTSNLKPSGRYLGSALAYATRIKEYGLLSDVYRAFGILYWKESRYDDAISACLKSIKAAERINDLERKARTYSNLGNVYDDKHKYAIASRYYLKSLRIFKKLSVLYPLVHTYNNLGACYANSNNFKKALENYKECIKIAEKIRDCRTLGYAFVNASEASLMLKDDRAAEQYSNKAFEIFTRLGAKFELAFVYNRYALISKHRKNWQLYEQHLKKSIGLLEKIAKSRYLGDAYFELAQFYKQSGRNAEHLKYLAAAAATYSAINYQPGIEKIEKSNTKLERKT